MYYRDQFQPARGLAMTLSRELGERVGARERDVLDDPQVEARRWPDSPDCLELRVADAPARAIVIRRRDRAIVG